MVRPLHKPAIVYMAINIVNGKRYIGMTSKTLSKRTIEHKCCANTGSKYLLHKAMRKYGVESIRFVILKKCNTYANASKEEIRLIAKLKPEYNLTAGGEGQLGRKMSEEHKRKLHGPKSKKTIEKLRIAGLRDRDKWRERSHLGPKASSRRVICLDDGKVHESASAAARHYGSSKSAMIELCLGKNFRQTVNKRRFKYIEPWRVA